MNLANCHKEKVENIFILCKIFSLFKINLLNQSINRILSPRQRLKISLLRKRRKNKKVWLTLHGNQSCKLSFGKKLKVTVFNFVQF